MARSGLVILSAALVAATVTSCSLPEEPAHEARTNAEAAHGKPFPTQGPKVAGARTLDIQAQQNPVYAPGSFEVKAGVVNISFSSPANGNHNLNLTGPGAPYPLLWGEDAGSGENHLTYAVTLQKGVYTYYCSVQGHRTAGMQGIITVS